MKPLDWVRLPSGWIGADGLKEFKWGHGGEGASQLAALMVLIVIAHSIDAQTGFSRITYNDLTKRACLSRAMIARALTVLRERQLITHPADNGRSVLGLANYDQIPWAKLPFRGMYEGGRIKMFDQFHLRNAVELDAMKLFLLLAQRRNDSTNLANISYDKIESYTGIARARIKSAISLLVTHLLIHVEQIPSEQTEFGISHAYRLVGVDSHVHMGTRGRAMLQT